MCLQDLFGREEWMRQYLAGQHLTCLEPILLRQLEARHWKPFVDAQDAEGECPEMTSATLSDPTSVLDLHATLFKFRFPKQPALGFPASIISSHLPPGLLPEHWDDGMSAESAAIAVNLLSLMLDFSSSGWPIPCPMLLALLAVRQLYICPLHASTPSQGEHQCLSDSDSSEASMPMPQWSSACSFQDVLLSSHSESSFNAQFERAWATVPHIRPTMAECWGPPGRFRLADQDQSQRPYEREQHPLPASNLRPDTQAAASSNAHTPPLLLTPANAGASSALSASHPAKHAHSMGPPALLSADETAAGLSAALIKLWARRMNPAAPSTARLSRSMLKSYLQPEGTRHSAAGTATHSTHAITSTQTPDSAKTQLSALTKQDGTNSASAKAACALQASVSSSQHASQFQWEKLQRLLPGLLKM